MAVVPVYNSIIVPDASLVLKNDYYQKITGKNPVVDEKVILVVCREQQSRDELTEDSFYPVGVSGVITEVNAGGYLVIRAGARVNLNEVTIYQDHSIDLSISKRRDIDDVDWDDADRRLKEVKKALVQFAQEQFENGGGVRGFIARCHTMAEVAAAMSPWMVNTAREKYEVLEIDSLSRRIEVLEQMIYENLETARVNNEAQSAQQQDYQKVYRESAIKKQIEYLQKELDEMHPEQVSELRRFEIKVEESGMNETARKEADKVLNRLKQEGSNSAEAGMLYDYLDFLTSLSWKKEKTQEIDLDEAEKTLEESHFGLKKAKDRILQQIAVMNLKRQQSGSILLFVGAPGTGKTSIGQGIAKALNRKYVRVSLGGVRDEADIRGHRRTYIGAMPGRIMDGIQKSGVSNPVMVLDEVDKLSASYNGDPASALLEVLDPEQNSTFTDHYMNVPYDLSGVLFICTANTTDTIPEPLLNRMEVIPFQGYTPLEKYEIAQRHLMPRAMRSVGIKEENLSVDEDALRTIISDYTREAGVRGLKKRLDTLCRIAAVELVRGQKQRPENQSRIQEKDPGNAVELSSEDRGNAVELSSEDRGNAVELSSEDHGKAVELDSEDRSKAVELSSDDHGKTVELSSENSSKAVELSSEDHGKAVELSSEDHDKAVELSSEDHGKAVELSSEDRYKNQELKGKSGKVQVHVTMENLRSYLDAHPIRHGLVKKETRPGIITGLAWTAVGGEILFIETMLTKGSGKVTITGQLGDVMKESAQIAVSLAKYLVPDAAEQLNDHDLHIHVPDGSTPKDGPSAGITLTTALVSLLTGKAVTGEVAMTGEISLQGEVNPIGGLPEKLMAAQRAGVKTVFIPEDNVDDLRDVAEEVRSQLTIIPVKRVTQVLERLDLLDSTMKLAG